MWLTKTRFNEIAFGQYIDIKLEANFSALTAEVNAKELNDILNDICEEAGKIIEKKLLEKGYSLSYGTIYKKGKETREYQETLFTEEPTKTSL